MSQARVQWVIHVKKTITFCLVAFQLLLPSLILPLQPYHTRDYSMPRVFFPLYIGVGSAVFVLGFTPMCNENGLGHEIIFPTTQNNSRSKIYTLDIP